MNTATRSSNKLKYFAGVCVLLIVLIAVFSITFKVSPVSWALWGVVNETDGVALDGYDAVAYHSNASAIKGDLAIIYNWKGIDWYFSTVANRSSFAANPEMFAPRLGGYCATAVSEGLTIDVNPQAWHVEKQKLYLFFDTGARDDFVSKIPDGIIEKAEKHWTY